ncbi:hypothetical protein NLX83_21475 [Allokutzneria sp. A3M-2-11 16]|uniref:hypothetical protein n=1 Tax=Allokutzneria sp. A3M-2-11 16 TaxID=2962043 RepID=UPI0020B688B1|nr:hypothetical protein [Allokutzneria sp. A3M-2-11 16]MCP3801840.1 hypothetical protein [Allokutzneria sp. A3M-2-11 16]
MTVLDWDTAYRCHRGHRCTDAERVELALLAPHLVRADGPRWVRLGARIATLNGLCSVCTEHVRRAISALPLDYAELSTVLGVSGGGGAERVAGSRELPVPVRLEVEATQRKIAFEADRWAEIVADVRCLSWAVDGLRPAVMIERAAALLTERLDVLLTVPPWPVTEWNAEGAEWSVVECDGLTGALTLMALHTAVTALAGRAEQDTRLPMPCPRCERLALRRPNGTDHADCRACHHRLTADDLDAFTVALTGSAPGVLR